MVDAPKRFFCWCNSWEYIRSFGGRRLLLYSNLFYLRFRDGFDKDNLVIFVVMGHKPAYICWSEKKITTSLFFIGPESKKKKNSNLNSANKELIYSLLGLVMRHCCHHPFQHHCYIVNKYYSICSWFFILSFWVMSGCFHCIGLQKVISFSIMLGGFTRSNQASIKWSG